MIETIKEYASKRIDLLKIEATEKSSLSAGLITYFILILVSFTFFIVLFNFGLAYLIGRALNNTSYGFLIVAGFYFLIMALVVLFKKKIVNFVADQVIKFLNQ
ncbi:MULTISPECIES: phage holin family protein [Chryseobacterium]|uniref:Membrane protein n=1 Tax=Chryseobacterium camelliae TaxID=1265445 RepID=A0ABU0TIY7_9FLAO|nr:MULTISPECIES: phage holin family protein [Chryseobacterium]MDT3406062.1 putative membrane protein [Pseudacidovorax intermedius]MDQ1096138.1 putative membrane protein [Chryseobacterium camelliae]MDQ1100074.1 putative membrane protein [Chryseobacterium sp. SORGH_AS_1048]MDR6087418.1 putative membrane protein [Chryseobacterium sp. SORGH_AS_0909]MDR6131792.1 putative membrane protein [Chryseobacterium sp. SORGH_AS_1175]